MNAWIPIAIGLLLCAGCQKTEPTGSSTSTGSPTSATTTAAATAATASAVASAGPADEAEGIPTEEDFEEEADQKISAQNAQDELDKLEKEITD